MSDSKASDETYKASCHCGAFVYNVTTSSLNDASTEVTRCNCSICQRNGYLNIYVPNEQVAFEKGSIEEMKSYTFASHSVAHYFCTTCGSSCMVRSVTPGFFDGTTIVNVRLLEDVDVEKLTFKDVDGKNYSPEDAKARVAEIEVQK